MKYVKVLAGTYRNEQVQGNVFPLIKSFTRGKKSSYITVDATKKFGRNKARITVVSPGDVVQATPSEYEEEKATNSAIEHINADHGGTNVPPLEFAPVVEETDEEILKRLEQRFQVLDLMTEATVRGKCRGLIVTGPPGVGKSFGVEKILEQVRMVREMEEARSFDNKYHIVKGQATPLGLYANLWKAADKGHVIVFDDCDGVLQDELCLNLLKAATDSSKKRRLAWNSSKSTYLEENGIPEEFEFNGAVIFITNLKFDEITGKNAPHMEALQSRCHYLDLQMNTMREKFLRVEQVMQCAEVFEDRDFLTEEDKLEVVAFMKEKKDIFREISIRMLLKISDSKAIDPENWKMVAETTCCY